MNTSLSKLVPSSVVAFLVSVILVIFFLSSGPYSSFPLKTRFWGQNDKHLRTTVPFVTAHLEIFYCTHHPVIPESDLYFTFCSTSNALSKRTSKQLLMDYSIALGSGMNPSTPLNWCEINERLCFA